MILKTLHRKLKTEQYEPNTKKHNPSMNSGTPKRQTISAPLVFNYTNLIWNGNTIGRQYT
jgi:hypothetical protein